MNKFTYNLLSFILFFIAFNVSFFITVVMFDSSHMSVVMFGLSMWFYGTIVQSSVDETGRELRKNDWKIPKEWSE